MQELARALPVEAPGAAFGDARSPRLRVVTLCTGNAARSVIAGALLAAALPDVAVQTAGTHVVEHQPMSMRTRRAFEHLGVDLPRHRSHQLTDRDVAGADLVLAMAADHVRYVRRRHPEAAGRTATIRWLVAALPGGPAPLAGRLAALALADVDPGDQPEIDDPAGGDDAAYVSCAEAVAAAVTALAPRLCTHPGGDPGLPQPAGADLGLAQPHQSPAVVPVPGPGGRVGRKA